MNLMIKFLIFVGPISGVLSGIISISILINCCHDCSVWVPKSTTNLIRVSAITDSIAFSLL